MPMPAMRTMIDMSWSYPKFVLFRDRQPVFSAIALHSPETLTIDDRDGAERVSGEAVGSAYFSLIGARPAIGRGFLPSEDSIGAGNSVAVVSDAFWRSRLGADANPLGRTIEIGGTKAVRRRNAAVGLRAERRRAVVGANHERATSGGLEMSAYTTR
jgi:hypothetical protein